jgi:curved DNA-binding protein CbpA
MGVLQVKRCYYEVLGVSRGADAGDIRGAYKRLAQIHHPDKNGGDDAMFKEIRDAYRVLSDPILRGRYDAGEMDELTDPELALMEALEAAVRQVVSGTFRPDESIKNIASRILSESVSGREEMISRDTEGLRRLEKISDKVSSPLYARVIRQKVEPLQNSIAHDEKMRDALLGALDILDDLDEKGCQARWELDNRV